MAPNEAYGSLSLKEGPVSHGCVLCTYYGCVVLCNVHCTLHDLVNVNCNHHRNETTSINIHVRFNNRQCFHLNYLHALQNQGTFFKAI